MSAPPAPSKRADACAPAQPADSLPQVRSVDPIDLDLILSGGSNALLCGPSPLVKDALNALQPHLKAPVQNWAGSEPSLPSMSAGTLILEEVAACSASQQEALLEWLGTTGGQVQVIATTDPRLFDMVESGSFSDRLYYRLNIVRLDFRFPI